MSKRKKSYVMLSFGWSLTKIISFNPNGKPTAREMLGGKSFQVLSAQAYFTAPRSCVPTQYQLVKVRVDTKGQLEVDASSGHPICTWVNCWWREVGQFQKSSQIKCESVCWAVYVEPRIWNWESGSPLSSLKTLGVRLLWQIQSKAGETGDHVWDS